MSGQDSILQLFADSADTVAQPAPLNLFDVSSLAEGTSPLEGGIDIVQRVQLLPPVWLFIYLFILLGLFAWIRMYYGNIILQTVQASTNFQVASRMFMDNSLLQKQLDSVLYGLYFLSISLMLYFLEEWLELVPYGFQGGLLYLFNLFLLMGIFFGRIIMVNLAGFLFNRLKIYREYLYNTFIFNKLIGMAILPALLFIAYTTGILQQLFFWLAIVIVAGVLGMRLIRGVVFSFKKDVSIFYMFLYLCALEIIPLTLLYRWLEGVLK